MKRTITVFLFCMLFSPQLHASPRQNTTHEIPAKRGPMLCQGLMELTIPEEESDQEMEVLSIKVDEEPQQESTESLPSTSAPRFETTVSEALEIKEASIELKPEPTVALRSSLDNTLVDIYVRFYGINTLLREQDRGVMVQHVQQALRDRDYYEGPVNGRFSLEMKQAVLDFQRGEKIAVDGIVGPITMKKLGLY